MSVFRMSITTGDDVSCLLRNYFIFLNGVSIVIFEGCVEGLFLAGRANGEMESRAKVVAVADRGLEGDRYFYNRGSFSHWPGRGRHVTLIEVEVLASLPLSCAISAAQARRNILTKGIGLNNLVGEYFRVGAVVLYGVRLCDPCSHLDRLTRPGVMAALKRRGGLRADVVTCGVICVGDKVLAAASK